jgi:hypothetical protein
MFLIIWQVAFIFLVGLLAIYLPPFIFYKFSRSPDYKNWQALRFAMASLPPTIFLNSLEKWSSFIHILISVHFWTWALLYLLIAFPCSAIIYKLGNKVDKRYEELSHVSQP